MVEEVIEKMEVKKEGRGGRRRERNKGNREEWRRGNIKMYVKKEGRGREKTREK